MNKNAPKNTRPKLTHEVGVLIRMDVPHWFRQKKFQKWLNNGKPKFTWHQGGAPSEYSDVMIMVDPGLSGEGTDSDMPHHAEVVAYLKRIGARSPSGLHIGVWLANVGS